MGASVSQPSNAAEIMDFLHFLTRHFKGEVEDNKGYELLYRDAACLDPKDEDSVQRLFAAMSRGACELAGVRMSRTDAGSGPVDFLFTTGYHATALMEAKLISNGKFWDGIGAQLPEYMKGHDVSAGMLVAVGFTDSHIRSNRYVQMLDYVKAVASAKSLHLEGERVDARPRRTSPSKLKATIPPPRRGRRTT